MLENSRKSCRARANLATRLSTELLEFAAEVEREAVSTSRQCHEYGIKLHTELADSLNQLEDTARSFHGLSVKAAAAKTKVDDSKKRLEAGGSLNSKILSILPGKNVEKELQKVCFDDIALVAEV